MGPKSIENHVLKIFGRGLSEIGAPGTPGVSLGTKFLVSKIFSYHPQMMLFYAFFKFVLQKMLKIMKIRSFSLYLAVNKKKDKNGLIFMTFSIFCKTNLKNA